MTLAGKYSLAGKSAVVTGAGNGIGRAIALAFAEAGANVACVDLDKTAAEATAAAIGKAAIAVACDVSDEAQVEAAAKTILAKYPAIHILLNGAAGNDPNGSVLELTLADWTKVFGVNVAGAIRLAKELGPGHTIVTVLCDYGTRYQSKLFNPEFMRAKSLPVPEWLERRSTLSVPYEKV